MKLLKSLATAGLLAAAASPSFAAITLNFEGVESFASVAQFYNGGTDSTGLHSGANYGVSFGLDALALDSTDSTLGISHVPGPGATVMTAVGSDALMNVAAGFTSRIQFYYSSAATALDAVKVYSGLNGTGTLLASISLSGNATNGCSDSSFCHWEQTSLMFAGTAKSVDFGGYAGTVGYDNITLAPVPEPSTYALMFAGIAAVGFVTLRRKS